LDGWLLIDGVWRLQPTWGAARHGI
jgi:hypothetical protein